MDPFILDTGAHVNVTELADNLPPSSPLLRCSKCRGMLPEKDFSPKRWCVTSAYAASGELRNYRSPCSRGRHYNCNTCRRASYKMHKLNRL